MYTARRHTHQAWPKHPSLVNPVNHTNHTVKQRLAPEPKVKPSVPRPQADQNPPKRRAVNPTVLTANKRLLLKPTSLTI